MFRKCRLVLRVEVFNLVVQDEIQVKKKTFFFHLKIYKYLHSSQRKEECVYIF